MVIYANPLFEFAPNPTTSIHLSSAATKIVLLRLIILNTWLAAIVADDEDEGEGNKRNISWKLYLERRL